MFIKNNVQNFEDSNHQNETQSSQIQQNLLHKTNSTTLVQNQLLISSKQFNSQIFNHQLLQQIVNQNQTLQIQRLYKLSQFTFKTKELILLYIKKIRKNFNCQEVFVDTTINEFANRIIQRDKNQYQEIYNDFLDQYGEQNKDLQRIFLQYDYQEDYENLEEYNLRFFLKEIVSVLEESKNDQKIISDNSFNSIGFQVKYLNDFMRLELIFGFQKVQIQSLYFDKKKINIQGKIMQENRGLYAVKILNKRKNKQVAIITSQHIMFYEDQTFKISYRFTHNQFYDEKLILQFYLNEDYSTINYGKKNKQKYIPKSLEIEYTMPLLVNFQQPNLEQIDDICQIINKPVNEEFKRSLKQQNKFKNNNEYNDNLSQQSDDDSASQQSLSQFNSKLLDQQNSTQQLQNQDDVKLLNELEISIQEAQEDLIVQARKNYNYQLEILKRFSKNSKQKLNDNQDNSLDINYYNLLGLVQNGQKNLQQMKKEYENIQTSLNQEIQKKQENFDIINNSYENFLQKIMKIVKFKSGQQKQRHHNLVLQDQKLNNDIQNERIELSRLRYRLQRYQKEYEKQEIYGQDLHLIDLEKLKIENQQLVQKIQN